MTMMSRPNPIMFFGLLVSGVLLLGCQKETKKSAQKVMKPSVEGKKSESTTREEAHEPFHEPIVSALSKAGFKIGGFENTASRPYRAKECVRGDVNKLDVLICRYESTDAAKAAQKRVDQFVAGAISGVVRRVGQETVAIADREKVDLQGKQINKLLKLLKLGV